MCTGGKTAVGIVGYGHLGRYLCDKIAGDSAFELAAIWNRRTEVAGAPLPVRPLDDLRRLPQSDLAVDLVIEVAHPDVTHRYMECILARADYMIGSPTALALGDTLHRAAALAAASGRRVFVPAGAMWGADDIRKMADMRTLAELSVTMKKHPSCLKLVGELSDKLAACATDRATVLYEGAVRPLCALAPNNVNTMAAACVAAHTLGFDRVGARLVADPNLTDRHIVEVLAVDERGLRVHTVRSNPAAAGAVTGDATYNSFYASLKRAHGRPPGLHLC